MEVNPAVFSDPDLSYARDGGYSGYWKLCQAPDTDYLIYRVKNTSIRRRQRGPLFNLGTILLWYCASGYRRHGNKESQCHGYHRWFPAPPTCRRRSRSPSTRRPQAGTNRNTYLDDGCEIPKLRNIVLQAHYPGKGNFERVKKNIKTFPEKTKIRFVCASPDLYDLKGNRVLTCGKRRRWDGDFPVCEKACGVAPLQLRNNRILNGRRSEPGYWPWMAQIARWFRMPTSSGESDKSLIHYCAGTLVKHSWVVTAAHCLVQSHTTVLLNESMLFVTLGTNELYNFKTATETLPVKRLLIHSRFLEGRNDIGLMELELPVKYTDYVVPLCLPDPTEGFSVPPVRDGQLGVITGWGYTEFDNTSSDFLREGEIEIMNCHKWCLYEEIFCASTDEGEKKNIAICDADSGGPFQMFSDIGGRYRWFLRGISQFSPDGCQGCSGFVDVGYFLDWITENIALPKSTHG